MAVPGSTLADLQNRIITETNRDDLADVLASQLNQSISDAIDKFKNERFQFNEQIVTTTFTAGSSNNAAVPFPIGALQQLPSGQIFIDKLYVIIGNVRFQVYKKSLDYLARLYTVPQYGQPIAWAFYGNSGPNPQQAYVWPTPNLPYVALWEVISEVTPVLTFPTTVPDPSSPPQSNNWTVEGQRLICAQAKVYLYRNVFKDADAATAAEADVDEFYASFKGLSDRQLTQGRMVPSW